MSSYSATVCRTVPTLINLTDSVISTYASDGSIITLKPQKKALPEIQAGVYYVVDVETAMKARARGRSTSDLVDINSRGQGRDKVEVVSFRLYDNHQIKIYPTNNNN